MVSNIAVAERTDNLLCQDTGIPIYNVTIGREVSVDGAQLKQAIRRGCERATRELPFRSSIVHPITRVNEQTSCGPGVPVIHFDFDASDELSIEMIPKGSGSENNSFLKMAIPADGVDAIKTFVIDCVLNAEDEHVLRRSSVWVLAARPICACIWRSVPPCGRWAQRALTRRGQSSKRR